MGGASAAAVDVPAFQWGAARLSRAAAGADLGGVRGCADGAGVCAGGESGSGAGVCGGVSVGYGESEWGEGGFGACVEGMRLVVGEWTWTEALVGKTHFLFFSVPLAYSIENTCDDVIFHSPNSMQHDQTCFVCVLIDTLTRGCKY